MYNIEEKIQELEQGIKTIFEQTKLVTNVKIKGNLCDAENPLHLEYKISQESDSRKKQAEIRFLRTHLIKKLTSNFPQIREIKKDYNKHGFCREYVIFDLAIPLSEELQLKYKILQSIKKEIENYKMQRKHE